MRRGWSGRKTGWNRMPAKGTKRRAVLALCFRPQGATLKELQAIFGRNVGTELELLKDFRGWDIRGGFPCDPKRTDSGRRGRAGTAYKVVGVIRWDGRYRSFIERSL